MPRCKWCKRALYKPDTDGHWSKEDIKTYLWAQCDWQDTGQARGCDARDKSKAHVYLPHEIESFKEYVQSINTKN